jgi:MFS family permease
MARSPLPRRTRSIVDRLARRAHAFHRFAHHPLCDRYAGELIPLGRKARLCRGCSYAALGAVSGLVGALTLRPVLVIIGLSAVFCVGLLAASLATRVPKWLGRLLACALGSFACVGALVSGALFPRVLGLGLLALSAWFFWGYRRRGPNRGPCESCPEQLAPRVCSGLRPIVRRERAFRRVAQRLIDQVALSRS